MKLVNLLIPPSMPRQKQERTAEQETTVPLTEERLDVSKRESAIEATITIAEDISKKLNF